MKLSTKGRYAMVALVDLATAGDTKKLGTFHPLTRKDVLAIYKLANA